MDLQTLNKKVQELDLNKAVLVAIKNNAIEKEIIQLNQEQLSERGELANNKKLSPYSPEYAKIRRKKGLRTDVKQHYFSGAFFKGFKIEHKNTYAEISSTVDYEKYLEGGKENYGLQEKSVAKLKPKLIPALMRDVRKQLK